MNPCRPRAAQRATRRELCRECRIALTSEIISSGGATNTKILCTERRKTKKKKKSKRGVKGEFTVLYIHPLRVCIITKTIVEYPTNGAKFVANTCPVVWGGDG